jgi:hypothetical protein
VDRWNGLQAVASKYSAQRNAGAVTPPAGFTNYLGATSLSAYSVGASEYFGLRQSVEGFNVADLAWGTASAQSITISFWVRSSLTGTFGGALQNAASNRFYAFVYTISAANTWEYKTLTVVGDTSGTWETNNTVGLRLTFGLGAGSSLSIASGSWGSTGAISATGATSVVGTNGATFYITGVQLEAGSVATPFERRDYGRELQMCRRYLPVADGTATASYYVGQCASTAAAYSAIYHDVVARVPPTGITLTGAASTYQVTSSTAAAINCTAISWNSGGVNSSLIAYTVASGLAAGNATLFNLNGNKILFTGCEL